jgi:metallo-beta-lactamase class B
MGSMRHSRPWSSAARWFAGGVTFLVFAVVVVIGERWYRSGKGPSSDGAPETLDPSLLLRPRPMKILPGLYLLGGLEPAAAYVVETSEGLVLVDTGPDPQAGLLKKEMANLGLDWNRIRAIFLTHVHIDHMAGAQHLREATGAKVYAGSGDAAVLRSGQPLEAFFSTFPMTSPPGPTTVDVELSGTEAIKIGEVSFRVMATPGHSPGSMCYLMDDGRRRVLFAGDVILSFTGTRTRSRLGDPLGIYTAYLPPRYRGSAAAFLSTLRQLRAMPAPDLVLPGHPRRDLLPQSPIMTPQRWEALLAPGIAEMEELLACSERDGAHFLDNVPCKLLPDLYYFGQFKAVAVYGFFAGGNFFVVGSPGGTGLREFVATALRQLDLKPRHPTAVLLRSASKEETAGLADLLMTDKVEVIAPSGAVAAIQAACPPGTHVLAAEDLRNKGWFVMEALPLQTRGVSPMAYLLRWAGKSVLFTGGLPSELMAAADSLPDKTHSKQQGDVEEYRAALERLGGWRPDLWLPAIPKPGQNAVLYGSDWKDILKENLDLLPGKW